jgi:hypothetical protein
MSRVRNIVMATVAALARRSIIATAGSNVLIR